MIDRVPEELWRQAHDIVQEAVIKTIPKKRNAKRQKDKILKDKLPRSLDAQYATRDY